MLSHLEHLAVSAKQPVRAVGAPKNARTFFIPLYPTLGKSNDRAEFSAFC